MMRRKRRQPIIMPLWLREAVGRELSLHRSGGRIIGTVSSFMVLKKVQLQKKEWNRKGQWISPLDSKSGDSWNRPINCRIGPGMKLPMEHPTL
jgi:hypothetical protein